MKSGASKYRIEKCGMRCFFFKSKYESLTNSKILIMQQKIERRFLRKRRTSLIKIGIDG